MDHLWELRPITATGIIIVGDSFEDEYLFPIDLEEGSYFNFGVHDQYRQKKLPAE